MPWVQYDANNVICGVCTSKLNGPYTEVLLADGDPIIVAFLNPPPDPRVTAMLSDSNRSALLSRLKSSTPAQIDAYISANVTNAAQAIALLGTVLKLIALDPRQ